MLEVDVYPGGRVLMKVADGITVEQRRMGRPRLCPDAERRVLRTLVVVQFAALLILLAGERRIPPPAAATYFYSS
jgi:hypothetical protein